jgi:heme-degrading monooxygenase HmoA
MEAYMYCVTTRFRLKHFWQMVFMYLAYWRMQRDIRAAPGLIRHAFLLEGPRTCCTFSIWASEAAIRDFSNVLSHLAALRKSKQMCRDIWSAYWQLDMVSKYASSWPDRTPWPVSNLPSHKLVSTSASNLVIEETTE